MMRKDQEVGMDKNTEPNEGADVGRRLAKQWLNEGAESIPLSHLALDHPEPLDGWEPLLQARGIELLEDDLRRPAIRREDARRLAEERREWERESVEKANQLQESLERPPVPAGIPALENGSAMESLMAHDPGYRTVAEEFGQRPRPDFLAELLEEGQRRQLAERAAIKERKGK
jgi:hypothetical protein